MWVKFLLLFFVFSFLFKPDLSFNQDLGRHLKLGEIIWETKSIPGINLFSFSNPDFPFINTHWLFEVFVYLVSQAAGMQVLLIIKLAIFLLSVWIILKTIPKEYNFFLLPLGFIFLHVLRERTELRPEIFSFLFTALTLYILERYLKAKSKLIFFLPLIQLIWINTHIYFFVGFILQVIYILHLSIAHLRFHPKGVILKLLIFIFLLSVGACFINPNGLQGVLYPFNVTKNYGYSIVENQTMFLLEKINFKDPNFIFAKISMLIAGISIIMSIFRRSLNIKNILLILSGIGLALFNVRGFPYLVFLALPFVIVSFGLIKSGLLTRILTIIFGVFLILEGFTQNNLQSGLNFRENGKQALDFVLEKNLPQPIFNNFDIGSYIIYRTYPKYKVFVDGRPEAYPKEFFQNTYIPMQSDYVKFKELEAKIGFKTIVFSHTDQTPWGRNFLQNVIKDSDWKTIYLDNFMIILIKS